MHQIGIIKKDIIIGKNIATVRKSANEKRR